MAHVSGTVGFAAPVAAKSLARRRTVGVQLVATLALAISLAVAATAVSIGMARAETGRATVMLTRH